MLVIHAHRREGKVEKFVVAIIPFAAVIVAVVVARGISFHDRRKQDILISLRAPLFRLFRFRLGLELR